MTRTDLVLATLAAGGQSISYQPVQVQKLFFLVDREIAQYVDGPHFQFAPYDYGPFDSGVYTELERLQDCGMISVVQGYYRSYALTETGFEAGASVLNSMPGPARDYVERAAKWVRSLSFSQLVSAIYNKYPEMKAASVFRG